MDHDDDRKGSLRVRVAPLNSGNYFMWSNDLEIYLRGKGLWTYVGSETSSDVRDSESPQKRDVALAYIMMSITPSCKAAVMMCREPREVWRKLKKLYQSVSEASIDANRTRLHELKMREKDSIIEYSNKIQNLVNELQAAGHSISELEMKRALLKGLRSEFVVTAEVIRSSGVYYSTAVSNLIIRESTMDDTTANKEQALSTKLKNHRKFNKHKSKEYYYCKKKGHIAADCFFNPKSKKYEGKNCQKEEKITASDGKKKMCSGEEAVAMVFRACAFLSNGSVGQRPSRK